MRRRRLGQHYLVDQKVVRMMVESAHIGKDERVLEIGTGKGTLTRELARVGAGLEGYEVDAENFEATMSALGSVRAQIHRGDAFAASPTFDVLVSSLPYSESSAFVEWISRTSYKRAVVLLQDDFVKKVTAPPGSRDYRAISAIAQISSDIRTLARVGRESFSPPPKVGSCVVSVMPRTLMTEEEINCVKRLFSLRRRRVAAAALKLGISSPRDDYGRRRVYALTPGEVLEFCRANRTIQ